MRATPKTYTNDFRHDAIQLVCRGDRTIREVADALGVNYWTLHGWYKTYRMTKRPTKARSRSGPATTAPETAEQRLARLERENSQLRRENEQLKMDRAILKKAAAFFAKESE